MAPAPYRRTSSRNGNRHRRADAASFTKPDILLAPKHQSKEHDPFASDSDAYDASLQEIGMLREEMIGDGNCVYRAVSHQVYGTAEQHALIRNKCADLLMLHAERYMPFTTATTMTGYMNMVLVGRQVRVPA